MVNGITLSGLRAFGSGFLIFTDYARGSIRLSSLMDLPVLHIWTHDSISVGEDGPTHQPIEQLVSLRAIPGMVVIRPSDANEMVEAYRLALSLKDRPVALICTRQPLPIVDRARYAKASGLAKGGYVLVDPPDGKPDVILIGCGSEIGLCLQACESLNAERIKTRVVSMPAWTMFDEQDQSYQESVFPPSVSARVTVEESLAYRVGPVRRTQRGGARRADFWHVGAHEDCRRTFRLYGRACHSGGKGNAGSVASTVMRHYRRIKESRRCNLE